MYSLVVASAIYVPELTEEELTVDVYNNIYGTVKLLWYGCTDANTQNLDTESGDPAPKLSLHMIQTSACSDLNRLWIPVSTLFIHLSYSSWDIGTVKLLWYGGTDANTHNLDMKSGESLRLYYSDTCLKRQPAVTKRNNEFWSQPSLFIYHTHNKTLEHSSCCDMGVQMQTLTIWMRKVGTLSLIYYNTSCLKNQPAVTKRVSTLFIHLSYS